MNKEFWIDTAYRCAWTAAECLLGYITVVQQITEVSWNTALQATGVAVLATFIKQVAVICKRMIKEKYDE